MISQSMINLISSEGMPKCCRVPKRFSFCSLETVADCYRQECEVALQAAIDGFGVFLTGAAGRGKTHLAVGLMRHFLECYYPGHTDDQGEWHPSDKWHDYPVFLRVIEFFMLLRATYGKGADTTERQFIEQLRAVPLLVLDDLGAEADTAWSRSMLYLLLDLRYGDESSTIVTSNLSLAQISATFDDRISSRLAQMGKIITLKGPDFRTAKQEK